MKPSLFSHSYRNSIVHFGVLLVAATIGSGCIPNGPGGVGYPRAPGSASGDSEDQEAYASSNSSECSPYDVNVEPSSSTSKRPGSFNACQDYANADQVRIAGTIVQASSADTTEQICAFPMLTVSFTNGNPMRQAFTPDQYGFPMYSCQDISQDRYGVFDAVNFEFDTVEFDAVIIVRLQDLQKMRSCLYFGDKGACPSFAAGEFRDQ